MNPESTKSLVSRFDGAVWVLLLTALAYALAYGYECGYLAFFGIPADFAEVNLRSLMICAAISIVGSVFLVYTVSVLFTLRPQQMSERLKRDCALVIAIPVVLATLVYLLEAPWPVGVLIVAAMGGTPILNILIAPVFEYRTVKGYLAKLEKAALDRETKVAAGRQESLRFWKYIDANSFLVFLCIVASPFLAYIIGHHVASHQIIFLVPKGKDTCVVLRARTEGLLCARFETQTDPTDPRSRPVHKMQCEYQFLKAEGSVLRRTSVGPMEGAEKAVPNVLDLFKIWFSKNGAKRDSLNQEILSGGCPEDATTQSANSGKPIDQAPVSQGADKPGVH